MIAGYIQTVRESKKKGTNIFSTLVLVVYCLLSLKRHANGQRGLGNQIV